MATPIAGTAVTNLAKLFGCHSLLIGEPRMPGLCGHVSWRSPPDMVVLCGSLAYRMHNTAATLSPISCDTSNLSFGMNTGRWGDWVGVLCTCRHMRSSFSWALRIEYVTRTNINDGSKSPARLSDI